MQNPPDKIQNSKEDVVSSREPTSFDPNSPSQQMNLPGFNIQANIAIGDKGGSLPPANEFIAYNREVPGAGEIILRMGEAEMAHRHSMDRQDNEILIRKMDHIHRENKESTRFAFALALAFGGLSLLAAYMGFEGLGIAIATTTIVGLASVFIAGSHSKKKQSKPSETDETE